MNLSKQHKENLVGLGVEVLFLVLLLAALDYAREPRVVYAAPKPPRPFLKRFAARLGKQVVYLPLGSLSSLSLKKLRHFHVLATEEFQQVHQQVGLLRRDHVGGIGAELRVLFPWPAALEAHLQIQLGRGGCNNVHNLTKLPAMPPLHKRCLPTLTQ